MTSEELSAIVGEIRAGRAEDDALDWKRAFWAVHEDPGRREFLKDVAARVIGE